MLIVLPRQMLRRNEWALHFRGPFRVSAGQTEFYVYALDSPSNFTDPTGLYKLVGFPPGRAQQMRDAIDSAIKKLGTTCDGCAGPDGPKIAQALQNATFVYVPNLKTPGAPGVAFTPGVFTRCASHLIPILKLASRGWRRR